MKNFHWPDYAWSWIVKARKATISHLKSKGNCDVLISVSHPFSGHLVGIYAKRFFPKLKWIMDMGDPFCFLVQSQPNNFKIYGKLNKIIEGKCFDISDGMVVTTPETKNEYIRIFPNIHIKMKENQGDNKLTEPYNSKSAPKMTTSEMGDLVWG